MSQAESLSEPACPSAQAATALSKAIQGFDRAEAMGKGGHPFTPDIHDRIETLVDQASWLRPVSPEGALLHVMLANAGIDRQIVNDPGIRAIQRHLYAIRAFLAAHADLEGWQAVSDHFMPEEADAASKVFMMTGA